MNSKGRGPHRGATPWAAAGLLFLGSCFARPLWVADWSGPLDRLDQAALVDLARAHDLAREGDTASAVLVLEELARAAPGNLPVGIALQEARLALLPADSSDGGDENAEALAEIQRTVALAIPSVANLLLAARLAQDGEAASQFVESARSLEEAHTEAWTHYARAHLLLVSKGGWQAVRRAVAEALEADPGHVPSRRLEAWMRTRDGNAGHAASLLAAWLEAVGDDPRAAPNTRRRVRLDLARCLILDGEPEDALDVLGAESHWGTGAFAHRLLQAAARQATGDGAGALEAAQAAAALEPDALLPHIQEALVWELSLGDPARAIPSWERVVELSKKIKGLDKLFETLRAQVRIERAEQAALARPENETVGEAGEAQP